MRQPTTWGPWENVAQIGEGGMAHVFKVRNKETGEFGALKRLKNVKRRERLRREIEAVAALDHPGIVKLLDADLEADRPYAVYQFESGGSLANLATAELLEVPLTQRLRWCEQICSGLQAAHDAGLVHRDVKPENILLSCDRTTARLCDFGLVFFDDGERQTATAEQIGSRYYIAPELEDGRAEQVSASSDIYGMGKVLYYVTRGSIFARERHRDEDCNLARILDNPYLEAISRILDKSVTSDVQRRFTSAASMQSAIAQAEETIVYQRPIAKAVETYRCVFCGVGRYEEICISGETHAHNSGYKEGNIADEYMVFLECPVCGNCQRFKLKTGGEEWFPEALERLHKRMR